MTISPNSARSVESITEDYLRSRKSKHWPISVSAAIRATRMVLPHSLLTNEELTVLIAERAITYGHAVDFDGAQSLPILAFSADEPEVDSPRATIA